MHLVKLMVVATMLLASRADAALIAVPGFGGNPGALDMFEYVPAGLAADRPLVVVLHGCTQAASDMEVAGWNALADQYQFAVMYPQQRTANQPLRCFTWYAATDIARASGEAASIAAMVEHEIADHAIDPGRVYVTGISAGAAFTAVMLAAYPDKFAAGSIMAGIPYDCATDLPGASACQQMTASSQRTATAWGDKVRAAAPGFAGPWPRVQIWQGTADTTVNPANATELVKQWTDVWGLSATADATDTISTATRTQFHAGSTAAVELYVVEGMGHAIATGADPSGPCPSTSGTYFSDQQICATLRAAQFFGLVTDPGTGSGSGSGSGTSSGSGSGGCSTGGGGGSLALGVLAMFARRRRRR